jgi:hypothetical protein
MGHYHRLTGERELLLSPIRGGCLGEEASDLTREKSRVWMGYTGER